LSFASKYVKIDKRKKKGTNQMEPKDYIVTKIEGDYAYIKDTETCDELFIALALLPFGTDIGTMLHYENLEYNII
jgi:hypothetical protein